MKKLKERRSVHLLNSKEASVAGMTRLVIDEILIAIGLSPRSIVRPFLTPIVWRPANGFARLVKEFDQKVAETGFMRAVRWVLPRFISELDVHGVERIPAEGPLLITSNHPGTADSLAILANVHRPDIKTITSGLPLFRGLHNAAEHLLFLSIDTYERMQVLRSGIRHLRAGGALLIFPSGKVNPDPEVLEGADLALEHWSPSIGLMLKKVPETRVITTTVSGVLSERIIRSRLAQFRRGAHEKQMLAEFIQVLRQILRPGSVKISARVLFGEPFSAAELALADAYEITREIIERTRIQLQEHLLISPRRNPLSGHMDSCQRID